MPDQMRSRKCRMGRCGLDKLLYRDNESLDKRAEKLSEGALVDLSQLLV